jgi:hypothetical protein
VRAALQVNPYEYKGNPSPSKAYADERAYNTALLDACDGLGISLLAVTDHWCASSAAGLIEAARARGVVALPGFEAISSEGAHLLVIFDEGTSLEDLTVAIGACGMTPGDPHGVADRSYADIVTEMVGRDALVIPAHVNVANSGLLHRAVGKPLERMIKHDDIHALGVTPSVEATSEQAKILGNKQPYKRKHPLIAIHADDISHADTLSTLGASTWFKMSVPSFAGLKHALRTPETRVSLVDPASTSRVLLRELLWAGGFLDGQVVPLADDLTAIIGGRGTGKSTIIESLRYVLGIDPIGPAAKRDHADVIKNVVRTATTIKLTVDVISPEPARYCIERTVPDPPIVRDSTGIATPQRPRDIVGNLEIFGQHELAELAQDKTRMAEMVGRVAGRPDAGQHRPPILRDLMLNREPLARVEREQGELEEELAEIPRLAELAKRFSASDLGTRLDQSAALKSEQAVFAEAKERLDEGARQLADLDLTDVSDRFTAPIAGVVGGPREALLEPVHHALQEAAKKVRKAERALARALSAAQEAIDETAGEWDAAVQPLRD